MQNYSDKELLNIRNEIFLESGIPALENNGFVKSPFANSLFGRNNLGDFSYEMGRVSEGSQLAIVMTHISKGEMWVKVFLNLFQLSPQIDIIEPLKTLNCLQYQLPPNSSTNMRLRIDDIKGIPLFNYHSMFGGHRLKSFHDEPTLKKRKDQLRRLIEKDLSNIDHFVERWLELHQLNETDWEGNRKA